MAVMFRRCEPKIGTQLSALATSVEANSMQRARHGFDACGERAHDQPSCSGQLAHPCQDARLSLDQCGIEDR
jgi:hypothetical protein